MIIALSILNIQKEVLEEKIRKFESYSNENWIHFDVMDGQFVKNITFDEKLVKEISKVSLLFKDVHLMALDPASMVNKYVKAGANKITFHYESINDSEIMPLINKIKLKGTKAGVSLKPSTNIKKIKKYLPYLDSVLVMSVEPGKGGQKFLNSALKKIKYLKKRQPKYNYLIEVDGGIDDKTSKLVKQAGADVIIVGSYLVKSDFSVKILKSLE